MNARVLAVRLGWPGIAGLVLLAIGALVYLAATLPLRAETEELTAEADRLGTAQGRRGTPGGAAGQPLPPYSHAPEVLKRLDALAQKHGVAVPRSAYQTRTEDGARLLEVELPLKGAYPALRGYLRDVLGLMPTARLEDVRLHRAQAADPLVDADVRVSFRFAAAP